MSASDEEFRKNYENALVSAGVIQNSLILWLAEGGGSSTESENLGLALFVKDRVEQSGFPVDVMISRFYSHRDGGFTKPVTLVGVTIHKPPKNGTPEEQAEYDRWYKRVMGFADDPPEDPQK